MPLTYVAKVKSAQEVPGVIHKEIKRLLDVADSEAKSAKTRTVRANKEGKAGILRHLSTMLENMVVEVEGTKVSFDEVYNKQQRLSPANGGDPHAGRRSSHVPWD